MSDTEMNDVRETDGRQSPESGKPSLRAVAVIGTVCVALALALVTIIVLLALYRIVTLAEEARDVTVPAAIAQQERALMAIDLARLAEQILGASSSSERARALEEANETALRFSRVAEADVLSRLDAALHAVRRSAYRADMQEIVGEAVATSLGQMDTALSWMSEESADVVDPQVARLFSGMRTVIGDAAAARNVATLDALRGRYASLQTRLFSAIRLVPSPMKERLPSTSEIAVFSRIFDLRREYLLVATQAKSEAEIARDLLKSLSGSLSADAAAAASASASEIAAVGRSGILVGGTAFGIELIVLFLGGVFILRHVVSPILRAHEALEALQRGDESAVLPPPVLMREFSAVNASVARLAAALADIKAKERQALQSRKQMQFIFDIAPVPFLMTELESGEVLDANNAACALFRTERPRLMGRSMVRFWESIERRGEMIQALRESGQIDGKDVHLVTEDGADFWVLMSSRVVEIEGRKLLLSGLSDITERKAFEGRLQTLIGKLEHSNRELEQFAYVASHDLQEPLRLVTSYLQLLERKLGEGLDAEGREFVNFAVDAAQRMQHLIVDLLEYSRVGRNAEKVAVDMGAVVEEACGLLRFSIEDEGARVEVIGTLPVVIGDAKELTRLFQNLIGNALKYRSAERPPLVRISAINEGLFWEFSVADNGIGVPQEYAERVFLIFQRLHRGGAESGTGIGLAVCRKIVEQHGGKIWIDSAHGSEHDGEGCTLRFTLRAG